MKLEAKWQRLAKDGPADAFCKLGPEAATALEKIESARTAADPAWKGRSDAEYAEIAMRKVAGDCDDPVARMGRAATAHTFLARAFPLEPLPYEVASDVMKKLETAIDTKPPPTTDPAEAVKIVTADVDAVCACKDRKCALDATEKVASHVLSMKDLKWTPELMDELKAQSKRSHECVGALSRK